ncbi:nucleoside phosphatase family-domain-containing protein [Scleroderma yunnanense]
MANSLFAMPSRNSNNYERLEGGMGPARHSPSKKLQWKKLAIACTTLIALVWFLSPRGDGLLSDDDVYPPTTDPHQNIHTPEPPSPPNPQTIPTSPETDPDPLKTVHCAAPHSSASPLVQYALMIDAGSTGSRIHIYKFHNCGPSPVYEYEVFKQIQPGLSSYAGNPNAAAQSLDVLLDEALRVVPASLRGCTPVAVKATAGLRLLGAQESTEILNAVEEHLVSAYPFILPDRDAVAIMDGRDEGVYAWITANYLLDTIRPDSPAGVAPYAVLDLGGGSTQIVFEPERAAREEAGLKDGEHKYGLVFGGTTRMLYQHSYLGYGLKSARGSVHRLVEFMDSVRKPYTNTDEENIPRISNPCLAQETTKEVEIPQADGEKRTVLMAGEDIGSFEACKRVLELVMAKDAVCELKPCSFDGVYQPSLLDAFPTGKILLLSYFYDRITPLIGPNAGSHPGLTISTISQLAKQVCAGPTSWKEYWESDPEVMEELEGRPEWCLDLTFMHALLVLGYEFSETRGVELGKKIGGTELGWCLGATIAMVSGGEVRCQA